MKRNTENNMDYEKKYKDALERAKKITIDDAYASQGTIIKMIFPELAESDDEKIRKVIYKLMLGMREEIFTSQDEIVTKERVLAYLEKQKYDRMKPIYDARDSFESALNKAWKSYNESGARTVDSCEDDYIECAHAKGFREGYLFGLEKQKEQKPLTTEETELNSIAFLEQMGYTCIPPGKEQNPAESRKRDKPKESWLSRAKYEIEHADELLTQRQEELREIREMKKQEQKPSANQKSEKPINPSSKFHPGDLVVYDGPLGHAILQIEDVLDGRYTFVDNDSTLLVEDSDKFLRPLTPEDVEKPAEKQDYSDLNDLERAIHRGFLAAGMENVSVTIIKETAKECLAQMKSAEWSEEDKKILDGIINTLDRLGYTEYCKSSRDQDIEEDRLYYKEIQCLKKLKSIGPRQIQNVSDMITPNKEFFQWIYNRLVYVHKENPDVDYMRSFKERIEELSFDKPSWKPSEEQMKALCSKLPVVKGGGDKVQDILETLYDDLKKLI